MVIFVDLDGTLLDISRRYYEIHQDLCREFGLSPLPFHKYWALKRKGSQWVDFPEVSSPRLQRQYWEKRLSLLEERKYLAYDRLVRGAKEAVIAWRESHSVILVTLRRNLTNLHWQLNRLGLEAAFHAILASEEGAGDTDKKVKLIREGATDRTMEAIIVGDSEADIQTAKSLGIASYAVSNGIRSASFLRSLHPTLVAKDVTQLPSSLLCCQGVSDNRSIKLSNRNLAAF